VSTPAKFTALISNSGTLRDVLDQLGTRSRVGSDCLRLLACCCPKSLSPALELLGWCSGFPGSCTAISPPARSRQLQVSRSYWVMILLAIIQIPEAARTPSYSSLRWGGMRREVAVTEAGKAASRGTRSPTARRPGPRRTEGSKWQKTAIRSASRRGIGGNKLHLRVRVGELGDLI
jgi:hypothetical protein